MLLFSNPALNKEEQELVTSDPEVCLHRAVARGALSVDAAPAFLSQRVIDAVQSIAAAERIPPRDSDDPAGLGSSVSQETPSAPETDPLREERRRMLGQFPQLTDMLDQGLLTSDEALSAAQAIDQILGRYITGTRYAAP